MDAHGRQILESGCPTRMAIHTIEVRGGMWKLLPADADVMKWMESDHRKIIDGIGSTKKTAAKLFSEAAKCVMRSQYVRDEVSGLNGTLTVRSQPTTA